MQALPSGPLPAVKQPLAQSTRVRHVLPGPHILVPAGVAPLQVRGAPPVPPPSGRSTPTPPAPPLAVPVAPPDPVVAVEPVEALAPAAAVLPGLTL